ncbi:hypothetical protein BU17DRAFT_63828 [Hysterangium stoloniferum]|nr:hypothetical protein BU17DRAFT_63828 [Hysterangium stoloniferum]
MHYSNIGFVLPLLTLPVQTGLQNNHYTALNLWKKLMQNGIHSEGNHVSFAALLLKENLVAPYHSRHYDQSWEFDYYTSVGLRKVAGYSTYNVHPISSIVTIYSTDGSGPLSLVAATYDCTEGSSVPVMTKERWANDGNGCERGRGSIEYWEGGGFRTGEGGVKPGNTGPEELLGADSRVLHPPHVQKIRRMYKKDVRKSRSTCTSGNTSTTWSVSAYLRVLLRILVDSADEGFEHVASRTDEGPPSVALFHSHTNTLAGVGHRQCERRNGSEGAINSLSGFSPRSCASESQNRIWGAERSRSRIGSGEREPATTTTTK